MTGLWGMTASSVPLLPCHPCHRARRGEEEVTGGLTSSPCHAVIPAKVGIQGHVARPCRVVTGPRISLRCILGILIGVIFILPLIGAQPGVRLTCSIRWSELRSGGFCLTS